MSHAHNLVLDYFKGIGFFGAVAICLLCLTIFFRAGVKWLRMIWSGSDDTDKRILACYVAAVIYVLCNQMSDCFGPSTIGFLWAVYLVGVLSERRRTVYRAMIHMSGPGPALPGRPADRIEG